MSIRRRFGGLGLGMGLGGGGQKLGPELITNGDFATDTEWGKGTGVTITGGVAQFTAVGAALDSLFQINVAAGIDTVQVTYTIKNLTEGAVFTTFGGSEGSETSGTTRTANGTYTEVLNLLANKSINFKCVGLSTTLQIDDVSAKEVF